MRSHLSIVLAIAACGGCTAARPEPCPVCQPTPAQGVVFVIDGAGGGEHTTTAVRQAVADERVPLCVEGVEWTHGRFRFLADQVHAAHARDAGRRLAERISAYRCSCPCCRVYLVAHSAGSLVALSAAEALPPNAIDRIVLLAPAVSAEYDLRSALCGARQGIDVFSSSRDVLYLGFGTGVVGSTDRRWGPVSGRVGFDPVYASAEEACLYAKLRLHPWDSCVAWTGNHGGHYGTLKAEYLRSYVVPLLK